MAFLTAASAFSIFVFSVSKIFFEMLLILSRVVEQTLLAEKYTTEPLHSQPLCRNFLV
jgi:hypothetical protein